MRKIHALSFGLAVAVALTLGVTGAFAGDVAPAAPAKPAVEKAEAPSTAAAEATTKTQSPMCSMMGWVMKQVAQTEGAKPGCCGSAMKAWFAGGADVPLAGMRDQLKADGWTAESTIAFFKKMAAERAAASDCAEGACDKASSCDKGACDEGACPAASEECSGCDKAPKAQEAPAKPAPEKNVGQ